LARLAQAKPRIPLRRRYGTQLPCRAEYHPGQIAGRKSPRVFRWVPFVNKSQVTVISPVAKVPQVNSKKKIKIQNLSEPGSPGAYPAYKLAVYLSNARLPLIVLLCTVQL
jgi:hypothetical protein